MSLMSLPISLGCGALRLDMGAGRVLFFFTTIFAIFYVRFILGPLELWVNLPINYRCRRNGKGAVSTQPTLTSPSQSPISILSKYSSNAIW